MLPFLIGDLVPYDDEHWDSYLLLHDILAHCMAPCISPASISYLAVLIELHHVSFCTCYPDENITPKMHYMVHFPELIKRSIDVLLYFIILQIRPTSTLLVYAHGGKKLLCKESSKLWQLQEYLPVNGS